MATYVHVCSYVNDDLNNGGKTVNIYDTYAHALDHAATGLIGGTKLFKLDPLNGSAGDAIVQAAKTNGLLVDQNGMIHFVIDADAYRTGYVYIMMNDQFGAPRKVKITAA